MKYININNRFICNIRTVDLFFSNLKTVPLHCDFHFELIEISRVSDVVKIKLNGKAHLHSYLYMCQVTC